MEARLIAKALGGNREAFTALVTPRLGLFTYGIHRILQNADDTQAALQEALLKIHGELGMHSTQRKFTIWAYRVCLEQALQYRRFRTRRVLKYA